MYSLAATESLSLLLLPAVSQHVLPGLFSPPLQLPGHGKPCLGFPVVWPDEGPSLSVVLLLWVEDILYWPRICWVGDIVWRIDPWWPNFWVTVLL